MRCVPPSPSVVLAGLASYKSAHLRVQALREHQSPLIVTAGRCQLKLHARQTSKNTPVNMATCRAAGCALLTPLHVGPSVWLALRPSAVAPVGYYVCRSMELSSFTWILRQQRKQWLRGWVSCDFFHMNLTSTEKAVAERLGVM